MVLDLGQEEEDLAVQMNRLGRERLRLEHEEKALKARLGYRLGNAKMGRLPGGGRVTRTPVDVAAHLVGGYRYVRLGVYGIPKE